MRYLAYIFFAAQCIGVCVIGLGLFYCIVLWPDLRTWGLVACGAGMIVLGRFGTYITGG